MKPSYLCCYLCILLVVTTNSACAEADSSAKHPQLFNVKSFGATGDGKTLDTDSINKAIDAAHSAGGGTVYLPAGTYLCYSIHLQSNVALYLEHGATILAAEPAEGFGSYDPPEPNEPW